jgi:3-methyl-2-oxobutanoate hydroxymethyltransferase
VLGLSCKFRPKFVKQYVQLEDIIKQAVTDYVDEVQAGTFPSDEFSFK